MLVFKSRFTPGLENGKDVAFVKGETVTYRLQSGEEHKVIIDSEYMSCKRPDSDESVYGYEAIFDDDGERYFIVDNQIVDWKGKGTLG